MGMWTRRSHCASSSGLTPFASLPRMMHPRDRSMPSNGTLSDESVEPNAFTQPFTDKGIEVLVC